MTQSFSPKRMLATLPSLYPVTSRPSVDYTFQGAYDMSIFRPYLWDLDARYFASDQGRQRVLLRAADTAVDGVYGKALRSDSAVGTVHDYGIQLDSLGASWTLTFAIIPRWDSQPTAASSYHPFWHSGTGNPRFGYLEDTGNVQASLYGVSTLGPVSLSHALGWTPRKAIAATVVCDGTAAKTYLYVNGELKVTLNEATKANLAETMKAHRTATQAGTTGPMDTEAYFMHSKALAAADVQMLHRMFTTGFTGESRWVRSFMALGMMFGEIEDITWNAYLRNKPGYSSGNTLTRLVMDYGLQRRLGESDESLRKRLRNRLLEISSQGTINQIIRNVAAVSGLQETDILVKNLQNENGDYQPASIVVLLPPAQDDKLVDVRAALSSMVLAGVRSHAGTTGSFGWDKAQSGFDHGSWYFVR